MQLHYLAFVNLPPPELKQGFLYLLEQGRRHNDMEFLEDQLRTEEREELLWLSEICHDLRTYESGFDVRQLEDELMEWILQYSM